MNDESSAGGMAEDEGGIRQLRSLLIYHHLGLGDHFICNGLVRTLREVYKPSRLLLPTKRQYIGSVSQMYSDLPELVPIPVETDADVAQLPEYSSSQKVIRIGFENVRQDFDKSFYDSAGVPFSARWTHARIVRNGEREEQLRKALEISPGEAFILIHNAGSVGQFRLKIRTDLRLIHVAPLTASMLDWCSLAESAAEVHCIDSSFIHLAQTLKIKRGFFHDIRKTKSSFQLHEDWTTVRYRIRTSGASWKSRIESWFEGSET